MLCHLISFVSIHDIEKKMKLLSHVGLFVTPWTVACQVPPSMESSRQVYWSGLPFPSPGNPPDPGIEAGYCTLQAASSPSEPRGKPLYVSYVYPYLYQLYHLLALLPSSSVSFFSHHLLHRTSILFASCIY